MKKIWMVWLLCLCLLAGCSVSGSAGDCAAEPPAAAPTPLGETFRVVDERAENSLLVVKDGGEQWDVFTVSLKEVLMTLDGKPFDLSEPGAYQALPGYHLEGALVEIAYGTVMETYPGQLGDVTAVNILTAGFDDRCALYRTVLEDLWNADPALNDYISTVSIDLSQTGLTAGEQEALAMAFSWDHAIPEYLTLSYEELLAEGRISCAEETCDGVPHWEDGVLLMITEKEIQGNTVQFDAEKWRTALGAYFFVDCAAAQDDTGHWTYTPGDAMIS